jgi:hypothetical protein
MTSVVHRRSWRIVTLLLLTRGAAGDAQGRNAAEYGATCLERIPPSAFTRVVVYGFVDPSDSVSGSFASSADNLLQELVIKAQTLLGAKANVLPSGEPTVTWRGVDLPLHLTAYRDGRIVARAGPQPASTAASLMAKALDSISTAGVLDWSADSARDSIPFEIHFARPILDSAGHVRPPHVKRAALPLLSMLMPWEAEVSAKRGQPHPHYPDEARREYYEATIILSFSVDTTGYAVESSIHDVWPKEKPRLRGSDLRKYDSFVEASKQGVLKIEFVPARIGGCKVKQLVQMPFVYGLRR